MSQEESSKILGKRLEALREHHVVTWGELAKIIGISRAMLDFVRLGQKEAGPKVLRAIIDAELEAGLIKPQPPPSAAPAPPREDEKNLRNLRNLRTEKKKSSADCHFVAGGDTPALLRFASISADYADEEPETACFEKFQSLELLRGEVKENFQSLELSVEEVKEVKASAAAHFQALELSSSGLQTDFQGLEERLQGVEGKLDLILKLLKGG